MSKCAIQKIRELCWMCKWYKESVRLVEEHRDVSILKLCIWRNCEPEAADPATLRVLTFSLLRFGSAWKSKAQRKRFFTDDANRIGFAFLLSYTTLSSCNSVSVWENAISNSSSHSANTIIMIIIIVIRIEPKKNKIPNRPNSMAYLARWSDLCLHSTCLHSGKLGHLCWRVKKSK